MTDSKKSKNDTKVNHKNPAQVSAKNIIKKYPSIRILPMSNKTDDFKGIEEVQSFLKNEFVYENKGSYKYNEKGIDAPEGSLILFQYDNHLIASAEYIGSKKEKHKYYFKTDSIKIYEPISKEDIREFWADFIGFRNSKREIPKTVEAEMIRLLNRKIIVTSELENKQKPEALFINGIFESVLEEIIESQKKNKDESFFLQPYKAQPIKLLKKMAKNTNFSVPLYISTSNNINYICYYAEIIGWEDKRELSKDQKRLEELNEKIRKLQKNERRIYMDAKGNECVNLITIRNLKKLENPLPIEILIKTSDGQPLKERSQGGGWSTVEPIEIEKIKIVNKITEDKEFEEKIKDSLKEDENKRIERLQNASKTPERTTVLSVGYKRNPDVVAQVLLNAEGVCQYCSKPAPFQKPDGVSYLEVHHIIHLSEGGDDSVENAIALCPNCHKEAHFGADKNEMRVRMKTNR
jgi:5-methylcytosine-specific restriction enzyme A